MMSKDIEEHLDFLAEYDWELIGCDTLDTSAKIIRQLQKQLEEKDKAIDMAVEGLKDIKEDPESEICMIEPPTGFFTGCEENELVLGLKHIISMQSLKAEQTLTTLRGKE